MPTTRKTRSARYGRPSPLPRARFGCLGLGVGVHDNGIDLVIEPGGTRVQVKRRALVTDDVARRLLAAAPQPSGSVLLLVGDRVTEAARRLLVEHRAGYYDLRGHLALRSDSVVRLPSAGLPRGFTFPGCPCPARTPRSASH
jgi:hypothetical protein